ncbi:hypothetical protein EL79_5166 [Escherichia coli]|nr:hypothetical protein EL79_5166 [Escherichia coli]
MSLNLIGTDRTGKQKCECEYIFYHFILSFLFMKTGAINIAK